MHDRAAKVAYLTRLGDTALVLSHRLSELCGKGPALEEDMALANTALDLLGQARLWLAYAGEIEGAGRDEDALAYLRNDREFRNFLLVEQPNGNYAHTMMRQFLFDAWHGLALSRLMRSSDVRIAEIAAKSQKEVTYHLRRSSDLIVRMGDGTGLSREYTQEALNMLWPFTGEMFTPDPVDQALAASGESFDPGELRREWLDYAGKVFGMATLEMLSPDTWMQKGGKQGVHSEHLGYLLAEMQAVRRAHPGATW
ncbi:MAG: phenylacetate-CoA oxygenase subunit PaaC [Acidobacteriota bacterium]|nr:phenylacetate-CoA oxygenase subunit PaaC [Acidobacteriota bacterium]